MRLLPGQIPLMALAMAKLAICAFALLAPLPVNAGNVDSSDEFLTSAAKWIAPDEEFSEGRCKPRFYRYQFHVDPGICKAVLRCAADDEGEVFIDGCEVTSGDLRSLMAKKVDVTTALSSPGRHVLAVMATNEHDLGGVCAALDIEYSGERRESIVSSGEWRCAKSAPGNWAALDFDDSCWENVKEIADAFDEPWVTRMDTLAFLTAPECERYAAIREAREARANAALAVIAAEPKPVCRIVWESGKPFFDIGGQRFETMLYNCSEGWHPDNRALLRQAGYFRDAGMHLYGVGIKVADVWREDGEIDFSRAYDILRSVLSVDSEARFLFCFDASNPPRWWCKAHPNELVGYPEAKLDWKARNHYREPFVAPSFASEAWRRDMSDFLSRHISHLESSPFAPRIFAYRPDYGVTHEWHCYGMAGFFPDTGTAMTAAFQRWLERRYGGIEEELRRAWGDPTATFATATPPGKTERLVASAGNLRDKEKDRRAIDYLRCHHEAQRDCLLAFDRAAKDASGGRALVGNYCGYFFGMPFPVEAWHLENDAILDSPFVDFECAPFVYGREARALGRAQPARGLVEGMRSHGKLAIMEADNVTTVFGRDHRHGLYAKSRSDDLAILARDFAASLCLGCGFWYFDFGAGWYDAPDFAEFFREIYPIRKEISDCQSVSEILVVGDWESVLMADPRSQKDNVARTTGLVNALGGCGVPFDAASIADLSAGRLKDYKAYVFCNLDLHTPEKDALVSSLRESGRCVLMQDSPLSKSNLREWIVGAGIHRWCIDNDTAVYANSSVLALHGIGKATRRVSLPARSRVTLLYPERREIGDGADEFEYAPGADGGWTAIFKWEAQ